jgi:3-hydroxyisobutyrate dehydrogenase-like beta-hydroxyacid dehydrogenase
MSNAVDGARSSDVAVVGCGAMGSGIARLLRKNGHSVVAWNRTHARAEALVRDGITAMKSAVEAVASAPLVIACQTSYDNTWASLEGVKDWVGATFVNLATGTATEANAMRRWTETRGGRYLDGAINCYPSELGSDAALTYFSGDQEVWAAHENTLRELGGEVELISNDIAMANVIQLGSSVFYIPALCAYTESAAYLSSLGISAEFARKLALRAIELLRNHTEGIYTAIQNDDHADDEATLATYAAATRLIREELSDAGLRAPVLDAAKAALEAAQHAGLANLGISAQRAMTNTSENSTNTERERRR